MDALDTDWRCLEWDIIVSPVVRDGIGAAVGLGVLPTRDDIRAASPIEDYVAYCSLVVEVGGSVFVSVFPFRIAQRGERHVLLLFFDRFFPYFEAMRFLAVVVAKDGGRIPKGLVPVAVGSF